MCRILRDNHRGQDLSVPFSQKDVGRAAHFRSLDLVDYIDGEKALVALLERALDAPLTEVGQRISRLAAWPPPG